MESPTLFSRQYICCDAIEMKVGNKTVLYKLIYHLSCIKSFKAEYCNRMQAEARTQVTSSDTEQAHIPAAHEETYSSAIQFINDVSVIHRLWRDHLSVVQEVSTSRGNLLHIFVLSLANRTGTSLGLTAWLLNYGRVKLFVVSLRFIALQRPQRYVN